MKSICRSAPVLSDAARRVAQQRSQARGADLRAGFTLVESLIGISLMSLCATFAYATILSSNRTAVTNRLYTLAQEMARNQIERVQCAVPFNPQFTPPQVPAELATGTVKTTLPLYTDPTSNAVSVTAELSTTVATLGSYNARSAAVMVEYYFRGKKFQVLMNTIRTSDS